MDNKYITLAYHLLGRLERLSADSRWAHRASGLRGALLRQLEIIEKMECPEQQFSVLLKNLDALTQQGFQIVEKAAREIGDRT